LKKRGKDECRIIITGFGSDSKKNGDYFRYWMLSAGRLMADS
jgi:hypothetical protein